MIDEILPKRPFFPLCARAPLRHVLEKIGSQTRLRGRAIKSLDKSIRYSYIVGCALCYSCIVRAQGGVGPSHVDVEAKQSNRARCVLRDGLFFVGATQEKTDNCQNKFKFVSNHTYKYVCTAALVRTSICTPAVVSCDLYTRRGYGIVRPLERQQAVRTSYT